MRSTLSAALLVLLTACGGQKSLVIPGATGTLNDATGSFMGSASGAVYANATSLILSGNDVPAALINGSSKQALDLSSGLSANGTPIGLYGQNHAYAQEWRFSPASSGNVYAIRNPKTAKCVTASDNVLVLSDCIASAEQQWGVNVNSDGSFSIVNAGTKLCLDVGAADANGYVRTASVACSGATSQTWFVDRQPWVTGDGQVTFSIDNNNSFTQISYTMVVPADPNVSASWTAVGSYLSPGALSPTLQPIGTGWLESHINWGQACSPSTELGGWYAAANYANYAGTGPGTSTSSPCLESESIALQAGDTLNITLSLTGTVWTQLVVDQTSGKSVVFNTDLSGQSQSDLGFAVLSDGTVRPGAATTLTQVTLTTNQAQKNLCSPRTVGSNDTYASAQMSADGRSCTISKMVLSGQTSPATWVLTP